MLWRMGSLPVPRTRLIGRATELTHVAGLVRRSSRLVTLTGVGGVGKTRLAQAVAEAVQGQFRDGAWFVELSPLRHGALVAHVIAETLPLADQTTRPMIDVVAEYLAERETLLVLDTCEHLADACALAAEVLLRAAPGLRILATSRRPLNLVGEEMVVLDPLPVPEEGDLLGGEEDAVALLAERAAEAMPGFTVTDTNRPELVRLCRRLEGLPLAIELAAARLRELSMTELAEKLEDRFGVLGNDREAVPDADPPWHQALRTAIGWSHQLCAPGERLLWARLSVFAGSFDAETARQVCADEWLPVDKLLGLLDGLVEKSILTWQPTGDGERYGMLDTIREFGSHWLRALGEEDLLRCRHLDYYLALAQRGDSAWLGPDQYAWCGRLAAELDNVRAALEFSLDRPRGQAAMELAGALWFFWHCCGFAREGLHYLERALALDTEPSRARARALWVCSLVLSTLGDGRTAEARATEGADMAKHLGDTQAADLARAMVALAVVISGDTQRAKVLALPLFDGHRCEGGLAYPVLASALFLGHAHTLEQEIEEAVAVLEHLRDDCERYGEVWMRAYAEYLLARAELSRGHNTAAQHRGQAVLEVKQRLNDRLGVAMCLDVIAAATAAAGLGERAARLLGMAQQLWDTLGQPQLGLPDWVAARERCETQARTAIGDRSYEAAYQAGRAVPWEAGMAYARSH
ncbi:NB-ARC domain-containing protein [Streptomyces sp. NPDC047117]|uniref:ATP-binding protein n=1 Tax=Streptomyces sp. NPDC047117 TaxID=3155379 RepID=UPI0033BFD2C3